MAAKPASIRPARPEDAPALRVLSEQLGYPSTLEQTLDRLEVILARSDHALLIAQNGQGAAIGWVHGILRPLLVEPPHIEIGGLVVEEAHRSLHIGEALMSAIEDWARQSGAEEVHVYSNVMRERAHAFYERIGYVGFKQSRVFRKKL